MRAHRPDLALFCLVRSSMCALPLSHVIETMRQLPVEQTPGSPPFVLGLAIIRGDPVAVVDLAQLVGGESATPTRWVTIAVGDRRLALAVGHIFGVRSVPAEALCALPPLLQNTNSEIVAAIGTLDMELLLVLNEGRLIPDDIPEAVPA